MRSPRRETSDGRGAGRAAAPPRVALRVLPRESGSDPYGRDAVRAVRVNEASHHPLRKLLAFAAAIEVGTGLALMVDPAIVARLLLGTEVSGVGTMLGRCFGIALLGLGVACWPSRESGSAGFRAMLIYNVLIALYLACLGAIWHVGGWLLWPGVALHAVVALLLVWTWRSKA